MDALLRDLRTAPAPALMAVSGAGFISLAISPPATPGLSLCGSLSSVTLADLSPLVLDGHTLGILGVAWLARSEEHTSELQSQSNLVCRLLLEKKKTK